MLLHIPETSPSITNCHMIKVTYELKVKAKLANKVKVVACLPITIGTTVGDAAIHNKYSEQLHESLSRCSSQETISSSASDSFLLY